MAWLYVTSFNLVHARHVLLSIPCFSTQSCRLVATVVLRTVHVLRLMVFLQVVKHPMLFVGLNNFFYDEVVTPRVPTDLMDETISEELDRERSNFSRAEKDSKDKDEDKASGNFAYDSATRCYLFERKHHFTFSETTTDQICKFNILVEDNVECVSTVAVCSLSDITHHNLLPYFYSNRGILSLYLKTDAKLHKELDEKLNDSNQTFPLYEPYRLPLGDFKEDHWTRRLVCGLKKLCQKSKVFSSTSEGTGNNFRKFLADGLGVSATTNKAFLFQGAPDVLIRTTAVMMCSTGDSDAESEADSESGVIENCHQRPQLKTVMLGLPEKLGKLIACQHTVLAAKILKRAMHA